MTVGKKRLEMIVDVRPVREHKGAWVVSTCVEANGVIIKRYIESYEYIKCGALGVFNGYEFQEHQNYYDAKYDIAKVQSVHKNSFFGGSAYDKWIYNVYSPKGGFSQFYPSNFYYDVARADNIVLLDNNGRYIANLTTEENAYDLYFGRNLYKYGLLKNSKGYRTISEEKSVMPAVVCGAGVCNTRGVFIYIPERSRTVQAKIVNDGVWYPVPRPSDVVLLQPTTHDDTFSLNTNLSLNLQNRETDKKFGLEEYRANIRRMLKETQHGNRK